MKQVLRGIPQLTQLLEPELRMILLVLCCLQKQLRDLLLARFLRHERAISVLIAHLGLARKGLPQILFGFCSDVLIGSHDVISFLFVLK